MRSAPTLGSLLGASGNFFWAFGGGTTWTWLWAKAVTGTAVMSAAVTTIRQLRAPGNLKTMGASLDAQNRAAKRHIVKDL